MRRWNGRDGMTRRWTALGDSREHPIRCDFCPTMTIAMNRLCDAHDAVLAEQDWWVDA